MNSSTSDSTGVYVAPSRYPIRVLKQLVPSSSRVNRLDPLFRYEPRCDLESPESKRAREKGKQKAQEQKDSVYFGGSQEEERLSSREVLTFESPIEGEICQWCVKEGTLLTDPNRPILRIVEPCKHPVQLGGLCAVCGKDLTSIDYTGFSETARASIQMTHDTSALTVSLEEAARLEHQTSERLLREQKLSLIVDLDQTIIHATVDPTVGDWMNDASNPNNRFLRDVQKFRLMNEQGKEDGCWYYVKPRPTLVNFLEQASKLYEMHVYTMGTRAYAENVCKIIDPQGQMFANRILSRDESGSMVQKSLTRLFPVDTSMVVIIDDRADVWDWSPNLVKVIPYEFFVGIGDINGAFLPKQKPVLPSSVPSSPSSSTISTATSSSVSPATPASNAIEDTAIANLEQADQLDHQIHDRPLLKMQEEKSKQLEKERKEHHTTSTSPSPAPSHNTVSKAPTPEQSEEIGQKSPNNQLRSTTPNKPSPSQQPIPKLPAEPKPQLQPIPTSISNGIGTSRFVSKMQVDNDGDSDNSDSDDDDTSSEEEAPSTTVEAQVEPSQNDKKVDIAKQQEQSTFVTNRHDKESETKDVSQEEMVNEDTKEAEPEMEGSPLNTGSIEEEEEAVLRDDDRELDRVLQILTSVHQSFYGDQTGERPDVPTIIPQMKSKVLRGCHIVFSSVIPPDQRPELADIWMTAELHGAICQSQVTSRTTHLVAAKPGTSKVHAARRRKNIKIVTPSWLLDSVAKWNKEHEELHSLPLEEDGGDNSSSKADKETIVNSPTSTGSSFRNPSLDDSSPDSDAGPSSSGATIGDEIESEMMNRDGEEEEGEENSGLHDIDWGDAAAEVNALLEETDDDDDGLASADVSDAESTISSTGNTTTATTGNGSRKRIRTPSASPGSRSKTVTEGVGKINESPLSKRRKVAAARAGQSKLKLSESINPSSSITTAGLSGETASTTSSSSNTGNSRAPTPALKNNKEGGSTTGVSDDDEEDDDDDDELDDFAKELEGELS